MEKVGMECESSEEGGAVLLRGNEVDVTDMREGDCIEIDDEETASATGCATEVEENIDERTMHEGDGALVDGAMHIRDDVLPDLLSDNEVPDLLSDNEVPDLLSDNEVPDMLSDESHDSHMPDLVWSDDDNNCVQGSNRFVESSCRVGEPVDEGEVELLVDAVVRDDVKKIEGLLGAGVSPNVVVPYTLAPLGLGAVGGALYGINMLGIAAWAGNSESVRELLRHQADTNYSNDCLWTPIMVAVCSHAVEIVGMLVEHGANVDATNMEGWTALMLAARFGDEGCIRVLLVAGAYVDNVNVTGETALMVVAGSRRGASRRVVEMLLEAGSSVDLRNAFGETALMMACQYDYERDSVGDNAALVHALLEGGAEVNVKDKWGRTALMIACDSGGEDKELIVEELLCAGSDVNLANDEGVTALMFAASNGATSLCEALVEWGADVNARDDLGDSSVDRLVNCFVVPIYMNTAAELITSGATVRLDKIESIPLLKDAWDKKEAQKLSLLVQCRRVIRVELRRVNAGKHFADLTGELPLPCRLRRFICDKLQC